MITSRTPSGKDLRSDAENQVDCYFDLVCQYAPAVNNLLPECHSLSIADYVQRYALPIEPGYQQREDFFEKVYEYLFPLHGADIARKAVQDLAEIPCALTANHHGVDFFAQSVQGSLLFSLVMSSRNPKSSTVPILACANVPLNNLTYPRGMLVYHAAGNQLENVPQKIPIFSDREKNGVVSLTGSMDKAQLQRAAKQVDKMRQQGDISAEISDAIHDIFEKDYGDPFVRGLKNYSEQAVVLNQRIWKRMYSEPEKAMDMIYMELETIVCKLLETDLYDPHSLVSLLMFTPDIRTRLLHALNGQSACWQADKLANRLQGDVADDANRKQSGNCGTHFFWGVDPRNKLIPLVLDCQGANHMLLKGKDDRGNVYSVSFDPASIGKALLQNQLLPSLFTCYATLSLARGIICIGGYYQSEYLPVMQKSVVHVLKNTAGLEEAAVRVNSVNTASYLSGMQTIMTRVEDHSLIPAGPVEMIANGGLDKSNIAQLKQLTIKEAHMASLFETLPDVVPYAARAQGWQQEISRLCQNLLRDKVVVI